ncbi:metallophosphoesterase family protein [bacterium]|nr:metallophosphoesterase family protein [bacterium]
MKIVILSDIHGNLEALNSILHFLDHEKIDQIICLGDIVGYGANPNECIELIRTTCDLALIGNHDHAALGHLDISYFNPYAKKSVIWTGSVLKDDNRQYLENLPLTAERPEATYVHSTPHQPRDWSYIFTVYDARLNFKFFTTQVCFIGHSHQPVFIVLSPQGEIFVQPPPHLELKEGYRYIINVGSVGQPRDGNPDSSVVIFDLAEGSIRLVRLPYDIAQVQAKMQQAQIHPFLIERLAYGR